MAKKATSRAAAPAKTKPAKPKKKKTAAKKRVPSPKAARPSQKSGPSASDALVKLIESPLVADLLAVGATAALAAIAESRFSRRDERAPAKTAIKKAASAAAAAMGRRIATEFDEIQKVAKERSGSAD